MLEIVADSHLGVTPYGAWRAVCRPDDTPERRILTAILRESETPLLTPEAACAWSGRDDPDEALRQLERLQNEACLDAWRQPQEAPAGPLERMLPPLLAPLSDRGQAVLADSMGFCLALTGYPFATGEALAAVGADILSIAERQAKALALLGGELLDGWGNVDAAGISGLSFWPIHLGRVRLALAVSGRPRFNQRAFADLVWALSVRYGED